VRASFFLYMSAQTETTILGWAYTNVEGDTAGWDSSSQDYLTARRWANQAISKWENYINAKIGSQIPTKWRGLWSTLTAAADGTKTLTAGTYAYSCPTNMKYPASYVRTVKNGVSTYWDVLTPDYIPSLDDSTYHYCYFTGNPKDGFTLNFNPELTLTTGDTITYEYYKVATVFSATTSTTEMDDPYFIVDYVTAMFMKDDDPDQFRMFMDEAEARLDQMATNNIIGLEGVDDVIKETLSGGGSGFGE